MKYKVCGEYHKKTVIVYTFSDYEVEAEDEDEALEIAESEIDKEFSDFEFDDQYEDDNLEEITLQWMDVDESDQGYISKDPNQLKLI